MEHLRDGIGLRGYGQKDPKQEYKKEGYNLFVNMMARVSSNVVTKLFSVQVQKGGRGDRGRDLVSKCHGSDEDAEESQPGAPA
jgi:preprotein translocase subunit SecA